MALLKFICADCEYVFEELTSADKNPPCPKCSSNKTKRHYQGKCSIGTSGGGSCSSGNCTSCKGCG